MLLITASFDLDWPDQVLLIFNLAAPIREITSAIVSFDCWMDTRPLDTIDFYSFYAGENDVRVIYQKLFINAGLPIVLSAISYSVWYFILRRQKKLEEINTRFTASIVLLLFLVHPSITSSMIDMFNCKEYDGEVRLVVDL